MSEIFAEQLTAVATAVLGLFAIVTAWYARRAFLKQSTEVSDQAEMLDLQRGQLAEQEKTSAKQAEVLGLQAKELQGSLEEREREAEERRRGQASMVATWFAWAPIADAFVSGSDWGRRYATPPTYRFSMSAPPSTGSRNPSRASAGSRCPRASP